MSWDFDFRRYIGHITPRGLEAVNHPNPHQIIRRDYLIQLRIIADSFTGQSARKPSLETILDDVPSSRKLETRTSNRVAYPKHMRTFAIQPYLPSRAETHWEESPSTRLLGRNSCLTTSPELDATSAIRPQSSSPGCCFDTPFSEKVSRWSNF